ncbi:MAG: hypothetical protein P0Y53_23790 [Candidatus Pseudobacter hemicellulosilyticus]|uniref:Uncharacterized protein n=1 Tax=Candidatus Pseudobacter hemicellulosilyticus TaxID=3121375 RepID=A0AAJ6BH42_9BACT|nr:MAG: hypothetical protein P0Y53_23790 [Pseudobacter sp.]
MQTVVSNDAELFARHIIAKASSIRVTKELLDQKLMNYVTHGNRTEFLIVLRKSIEQRVNEHKEKCDKPNCQFDKGSELAYFVIGQEMELIKSRHISKKEVSDFSFNERDEINSKLDEILEQLKSQGIGQEIIFNEINELREHFDLSKKNWIQLLKGKLYDMAFEAGIEIVVVKGIYNSLSESIKVGSFYLP